MERLIIIIFFLFVSCSSTKKLKRDNTKTKTEAIDSGELTIKRASDTLELTIPKIVIHIYFNSNLLKYYGICGDAKLPAIRRKKATAFHYIHSNFQ